jgi:hypothetical protein
MTLTLEKIATEKTFSIRYVCVSVYWYRFSAFFNLFWGALWSSVDYYHVSLFKVI